MLVLLAFYDAHLTFFSAFSASLLITECTPSLFPKLPQEAPWCRLNCGRPCSCHIPPSCSSTSRLRPLRELSREHLRRDYSIYRSPGHKYPIDRSPGSTSSSRRIWQCA